MTPLKQSSDSLTSRWLVTSGEHHCNVVWYTCTAWLHATLLLGCGFDFGFGFGFGIGFGFDFGFGFGFGCGCGLD